MSAHLRLTGVTLDYPIYDASAQSLRTAIFKKAIGGALYQRGDKVPIVRALSNVNFDLREGDRLALLGHNGSGKTTLLKVIAGILEPTEGSVVHSGEITSTIAFGAGVDFDSPGIDNIFKIALLRRIPRKEVKRRLPDIIEFSGLAQFIHLPVRTYSAGMIARLMFAVTTAFDPDILVLDEWLGAGDIDFQVKAEARMIGFVDKASLVVIGTHNIQLVERVCNKVCVLEGGQVVFMGDTQEWFTRKAA